MDDSGRKRRIWPRLAFGLVLALAATYGLSRFGYVEWPRKYDPLALPDLTETPGLLTRWQMKLVDADADNCALALSRAGLPASLKPNMAAAGQCGKFGAIELRRLSTARLKPEDTRCAIAARLYMWERNSLQPTARRILGEEITEIEHFGSYSCRNKRGGSSLSEHATANAFDISGFRTASGKQISVLQGWNRPGLQGAFLRAAHDSLCDWFNTTLGPEFNADHADHFHVDMGYWRTCR